ncbi:MAG TPA: glycosyltransferase, partial [Geobacteraceae bacterium]
PARTPFGWMKRRCLTQAADTIITLSLDQALNLRKVFPRKQVHFVPHGLDMAIPAQEDEMFGKRREQLKIVVVGSNYRNFDMLERIVDTRASRRATFHLVGLDDKNRKRFQGVTGVVCHDRLNSEQYEDLLRSSFVMALPLTFATANNALLEAHKFCLPSLCSDIPGVTDYATGSTLFFDQPAAFWRVFDQLAQLNSSAYREMCVRIHREACARFSWEKVRQQIEDYYLN